MQSPAAGSPVCNAQVCSRGSIVVVVERRRFLETRRRVCVPSTQENKKK